MGKAEFDGLLEKLVLELGLERIKDGREAAYDRYVDAGVHPNHRVSLAIRQAKGGAPVVSVKRGANNANRVEDVMPLQHWGAAKALFAASVAVQRLGDVVTTRTDWSKG